MFAMHVISSRDDDDLDGIPPKKEKLIVVGDQNA